ncbi:MAG: hypothetical protein ABS76_26615 [Pelagibacterium sp. SCN 64-44]|nr:MAG: hypothetical protein ABS76_26615 [Pelagibacterium sp. SCN 64-44]
MRALMAAATLSLACGGVVGAELRCERWNSQNRMVDAATYVLEGEVLSGRTQRLNPVDVNGPLLDEALEVESATTKHANGMDGPLVSVVQQRQVIGSPLGKMDFVPIVHFVDWGSAKASYVYTIGNGIIEMVQFDRCQRMD